MLPFANQVIEIPHSLGKLVLLAGVEHARLVCIVSHFNRVSSDDDPSGAGALPETSAKSSQS